MLILALDTCFASCSVALCDEDRVIAARREIMERGHAEVLAPMVREVLQEAQVTMMEVKAIAVTVGPGTFTGLRIGLAMAQGLALPHNIPLIPISSLQATAAGLLPAGSNILVCHQAGATGLCYVQRFDRLGLELSEAQLLSRDAIQVDPGNILIGSGAAQIEHAGPRSPVHDLPDAARFVAFAKALPSVSAEAVQPFYMRGADAKLAPITIQRVGTAHASAMAQVHESAFAKSWSASDLVAMLDHPGTLALLASAGTVPVGFLLLRTAAGETEILTLATAPTARRKGVARELLKASTSYLEAMQSKVLHLEVSADNAAALALYSSTGFVPSGLRRGYYVHADGNISDAILMRLDLP